MSYLAKAGSLQNSSDSIREQSLVKESDIARRMDRVASDAYFQSTRKQRAEDLLVSKKIWPTKGPI